MNKRPERVRRWFEDNRAALKHHFCTIDIKQNDTDELRGSIVVELDSPELVATITLWYKGDVAVIVLRKGSSEPAVVDDRVLGPEENLEDLLTSYIERIIALKAGGTP
jgi:hypothetical protein